MLEAAGGHWPQTGKIAFVPADQRLKAFFISPIGSDQTEIRHKANQALRHLVRKALEPLDIKVERADEDANPGLITPRMISSIMAADLVVIDLTGHNPNVFYEMAIAHGYRRPCVHIITEGQQVPFDVKDMRTLEYSLEDPDKLDTAVSKLRSYGKAAMDDGTTTTPLSAAEKFDVVRGSTDPTVEALAEIATQLDRMESTFRGNLAWQTESLVRLIGWGQETAPLPAPINAVTAAAWMTAKQAREREVPPAD